MTQMSANEVGRTLPPPDHHRGGGIPGGLQGARFLARHMFRISMWPIMPLFIKQRGDAGLVTTGQLLSLSNVAIVIKSIMDNGHLSPSVKYSHLGQPG